MLLKKVAKIIVCTITMMTLCTNFVYASTDESEINLNMENELVRIEKMLEHSRANFNLEEDDKLEDNLELGEIYLKYILDDNINNESKDLMDKIEETDEYIATIKLKDSGKPIARAHIKMKDSRWKIIRVNSNNSLEEDVSEYKDNINDSPIVILDEGKDLYAIGSEAEEDDDIKIIQSSPEIDTEKGDIVSLSNVQSKIEELENKEM